MGEASARKDIAARLRREIGDRAAAAVGELRELLEQTNKNHRALAHGLAQGEKRIDTALVRTGELADQVEAVRLRTRAVEGTSAKVDDLLNRVEMLEGARTETRDALKKLHDECVDEVTALPRWRWMRRRAGIEKLIFLAMLREAVE
jgi:chromosome segregation ATPase